MQGQLLPVRVDHYQIITHMITKIEATIGLVSHTAFSLQSPDAIRKLNIASGSMLIAVAFVIPFL